MRKLVLSAFRYFELMLFLSVGIDVIRNLSADCGVPGIPSNCCISEKKNNYTTGDEIRYFCDPNYLLFGPERRRCEANHTWNQEVPVCRAATEIMSVIQSSYLNKMQNALAVNDRKPGTCTSSNYSNIDKYWMIFLKTEINVLAVRLVVTSNSKYKFQSGNHTVEVLSKERNHTCNSDFRYGSGSDIIIYCAKNIKGQTIKITDKEKTKSYFTLCEVEIFVDEAIPCKLTHPDLPLNGNGSNIASSSYEIYKFTCNMGYELKGSDVAYCVTNGTWFPNSPQCVDTVIPREASQPMPGDGFLLKVIPAIAFGITCSAIFIVLLIRKRRKKRSDKNLEVANVNRLEEHLYCTIDYSNLPLPKITKNGITISDLTIKDSADNAHIYHELDYDIVRKDKEISGTSDVTTYIQQANDVYQPSKEKEETAMEDSNVHNNINQHGYSRRPIMPSAYDVPKNLKVVIKTVAENSFYNEKEVCTSTTHERIENDGSSPQISSIALGT